MCSFCSFFSVPSLVFLISLQYKYIMNCKQKKYLAIIESGLVGYEEFSDRRAEVDNTPQDMQNSSYPTKAEFNKFSFQFSRLTVQ